MDQSILTPTQKQLLILLSREPNFTSNFYFTGGTALAEYYLNHRYSEDLDFFSERTIDTLWLTTLANKIKQELGADKIDIEQSFNRNLVFFTFSKEVLKTEFTYFPFVNIEKPRVLANKSAPNKIEIDSLIDLAVNKFFTIYQNPQARHFIDLYLITKSGKIKWEQLAKLSRVKFDTVIDPIQLGSQLVAAQYLKDIPRMIIKLKNEEWRNYFLRRAKELKKKIEK